MSFNCHGTDETDIAVKEIEVVSKLPHLHIRGIFTHFAEADNDDSRFTEMQFANFIHITEKLSSMGIDVGIQHLFDYCCQPPIKKTELFSKW